MFAPRVAYIDVERVAMAVQFPYTGHGHCSPRPVVVVRLPEVGGSGVGMAYPVEFPHPVEGHVIVGRLAFATGCLFGRFIGEVIGVHRGTVDGVDACIVPFGKRLCICREAQQYGQAR